MWRSGAQRPGQCLSLWPWNLLAVPRGPRGHGGSFAVIPRDVLRFSPPLHFLTSARLSVPDRGLRWLRLSLKHASGDHRPAGPRALPQLWLGWVRVPSLCYRGHASLYPKPPGPPRGSHGDRIPGSKIGGWGFGEKRVYMRLTRSCRPVAGVLRLLSLSFRERARLPGFTCGAGLPADGPPDGARQGKDTDWLPDGPVMSNPCGMAWAPGWGRSHCPQSASPCLMSGHRPSRLCPS